MQILPSDAKKRKITHKHLERATTLRFKKRSDLITFSQRYPGALAAWFIFQVRQKLGLATPEDMRELAKTDLCSWASSAAHTGLKDTRDSKEMLFLAKLMTELGGARLPQAMDCVAHRVRELRLAKIDQGTWEKAGVVSLMQQSLASNAPLPDAAFVL